MATETPAGRKWKLHPPLPSTESAGWSGLHGVGYLPPIVAQLLHCRGITTKSEVDSLLNPTLHDPGLLPDMELACHRLRRAVRDDETIAIFGDFDVDGVTGTAMVAQGLGDLGANIVHHIPHRVTEGHGPNEAAVQALRDRGATVLLTVDCGTTSVAEVALASKLGMDVIITDHHVPAFDLPPALAIINPKLESSEYPFSDLSGGGLAFKLMQGLYDLLGQPWKRDLLELASLSTVADLVSLKHENRYLVKEGLKELRRSRRPGLLALYRRAGIRPESIDVETISFGIAPRLNAAGRLDHASTSYQLLLTQSSEEAESLAAQLETLNQERRQLTEEAWITARHEVLGWESIPPLILLGDSRFSPGIAGLVASRLVDAFHRPAVVMSLTDGVVRASARSIPGFDVGDALSQCRDLFIRHGGHRYAAGFTMSEENLPQLRRNLGQVAEEKFTEVDPQPSLNIDAEVSVASLTGETFRWLKELEPFGAGNPTPTFLTRNLQPVHARPVGGKGQHLRLKLKEGRVVWDAMAFRQWDRWVPDTPLLDVVYSIGTEWRGGTEVLAMKVLDFRPSGG